MLTVGPGQTITISQPGLPSDASVGYQVIKAVSGAVAVGRSSTGVVERPAGSGNYVATFVAPVEPDLYLIVVDWSGGDLTPETSKVEELQVTGVQSASTGLGAVADQARVYLAGETFDRLLDSDHAGSSVVATAVANVKARIFQSPPITADEVLLPQLVLSYLGKLVALELIPAAKDYWNTKPQSETIKNDQIEITTYPNRLKMLDDVAALLVDATRTEWPIVLPLIPLPVLRSSDDGPLIDELCLDHVTEDPRDFPRERAFPGPLVGAWPDYYGRVYR